MTYESNQKTKYVQRKDSRFRKITGLFEKKMYDKRGRPYPILKSGHINMAGWENMQAFGDNTIFLVVPNKQFGKKSYSPDYFLVAVDAYSRGPQSKP